MTVVAQTILDRAQKTLLDEGESRWTEVELLDYLNAGIHAICSYKLDAYIVTAAFAVDIASSRQELPAGGLQFIDLPRNLPGRAIRQINRADLDELDVNWHSATGAAIEHFTFDERDPKHFYIYPLPAAALNAELVYGATPAAIAADANIPIDDIYQNPLYWWVLAHAYAKNAKRGDASKMNNYLTLFANAIGARTQVQIAFDSEPTPDTDAPGVER